MNTFKVIIAGSRDFNDYEGLAEKCDHILSRYLTNPHFEVIVISGTARGADRLGERYAKERQLKVWRFPADWDKHGKAAGFIRNREMAQVADALIAFRQAGAGNKGTDNMIRLAKEQGLLIRIIN